MKCEYFVTKRPGRKRDNSHSNGNGDSRATINSAGSATTERRGTDTSSQQPSMAFSDLSPSSPEQSCVSDTADFSVELSSFMDDFAEFLTPVDPSLSPGLSGASHRLNSFLSPSMNFPDLDTIDPSLASTAQGYHDLSDILMTDSIAPDLFSDKTSLRCVSQTKIYSPGSDGQAFSNAEENGAFVCESESGCGCMMQALELMNKFFSPELTSSTSSTSLHDSATTPRSKHRGRQLAAETVIRQNKLCIESVSNMLECSCAETGFLLTVLAVIVFKILDRYTMAARQHPSGNGGGFEGLESLIGNDRVKFPAAGGGLSFDDYTKMPHGDVDSRRMVAQLILSELHRVQGLVNQLALRLMARRAGEGARSSSNSEMSFSIMPQLEGVQSMAAFSSTTLGQMETDLRKCVSSLSSEIIHILRHS